MRMGIPKEILRGERRVAATPATVEEYVAMGFEVVVEAGAGRGIFADDEAYRASGASIETDPRAILGGSDIVLKVKQPCRHETLGYHEAALLREGSTLVTFLHPATVAHHDMIRVLRDRHITSFTMDGIPRISKAQSMDALTSMSTVTGYKAVLHAACKLPVFVPMMVTSSGMTKPATFLVVGIGVVGLQALATIKRMGGTSTCVDIRPEAREAAKSLGATIAGFEVPEALARGDGGYARHLPPELLAEEQELIAALAENADVVILSALVPGQVAPTVLTREALGRMKPGAVVVDVSIDQGGNCEATVAGEDVMVDGVLVSGIQNIPGSLPVHATSLYAGNIARFVKHLYGGGLGALDWSDEIVRSTLVTRAGAILHEGTLAAMGQSVSRRSMAR